MSLSKKILFILLVLTLNFSFCFAEGKDDHLREYYEEQMNIEEEVVKGIVTEIVYDDLDEERPDIAIEADIRYQHLKIKLISGVHKGESYTLRNTIELANPYNLIFEVNEEILLYQTEDNLGNIESLRIFEKPRTWPLVLIVGFFALSLLLIGGRKGFKSILTLLFTGICIFYIMIPLLSKGYNPIVISVGICTITSAFTLVVVSGKNKKTFTAILGTMGGVMFAAVIALAVGYLAKLTGLGNEESQLLGYMPQFKNLDFRGLLFAGIIIGALGAVMDVAMSIASSMSEIEELNPKIDNKQLFKSGMNVGRDIMGSMSNTLILAYIGSSLQMFLLFYSYNVSLYAIVNMDHMASEVIRAMAGSIGLIYAIPITALVYIKLRKK